MNIQELLEKDLIRKQAVDQEEINGSIIISKRFLQRAQGNLEMNFFDVSFLLSYTSMFHAARALLFKAGYKERSHFGMIAALKDIYSKDYEILECLNMLDTYRLARHAVQYSGSLSSELDAIQSIKDAKKFVKLVKTRLG